MTIDRTEFLQKLSERIITAYKTGVIYEIVVGECSKVIDEFEQKIRQDQKEKCMKAVLNIVPGEEPIEQETIIHSIMEAD